jgi:hypothetical protein
LVISGNSEATDLAEAKLLWGLIASSEKLLARYYFFFLLTAGVGALRVSNGAK